MVSTVTIKIISYKGTTTTIRDLGGKNQKSNLVVFITKTKKCKKKTHGSGAIESAETTKHNYFRLRFLKT